MSYDRKRQYSLVFELRDSYLYAYVEGEGNVVAISKAYLREVAAECTRVNAKRLLIDENITGSMSVTEVYELASAASGLGFNGIRIAFVDRVHSQHKTNKLGELFASNRGVNAKVFDNIANAETWLAG
jgi:hypothetical protein